MQFKLFISVSAVTHATIHIHTHIGLSSDNALLATYPTRKQTMIQHAFKTKPVFETWHLFQAQLFV